MAADLWWRKGKIGGCFKNSTSAVLKQCQNEVTFQRKCSGIVLKFSLNSLKVKNAFLWIYKIANPLKNVPKILMWRKNRSLKTNSILTLMENNRSTFLKQPLILPFLCHKSATMCQIDSNKVSNSELKLDLCNRVENEMIESTAPLQQPHKQGTICLGQPVS